MRFDRFSFGSIQIDGATRDYDVVIDGGEIRKRKKKPSKQFRDEMACSVFRKAPGKLQPAPKAVLDTDPLRA